MPFGDCLERPSTTISDIDYLSNVAVIEPQIVEAPLQPDVVMKDVKAEKDTNIWMKDFQNTSEESKFVSV
jgi:hypothetical protein